MHHDKKFKQHVQRHQTHLATPEAEKSEMLRANFDGIVGICPNVQILEGVIKKIKMYILIFGRKACCLKDITFEIFAFT